MRRIVRLCTLTGAAVIGSALAFAAYLVGAILGAEFERFWSEPWVGWTNTEPPPSQARRSG